MPATMPLEAKEPPSLAEPLPRGRPEAPAPAPHRPGPPPPALGRAARQRLGDGLRAAYGDPAEAGLPEGIERLLRALDAPPA